MAAEVVVFGSVNLDLIAHVAHLPKPGETVGGGSFLSAPGGKGANQALAAARAGAKVRFLGAVGNDAFAEQALVTLREAGIDLSALRTLVQPTGTALILVEESGENLIAVASGANYALSAENLADQTFEPGQVVVSQLEMDLVETKAVLRQAKAAGARVFLNLAPFRPAAVTLIEHADLLVLNKGESQGLAQELSVSAGDEARLCAALARKTGRDVVVTLGAAGLVARIGTEDLRVPSPAVEVVDSVGAGDSFCGYLAEALAHKTLLERKDLAFAATAGALACTRRGAQPAIPLRGEVEAALEG